MNPVPNCKSWFSIVSAILIGASGYVGRASAQGPDIVISQDVPKELNGPPSGGGAPTATPEQAAAFAWQEFIALSWPAAPQEGKLRQRDAASTRYKFGDPNYTGPLVWQTFRAKVEIFPGKEGPASVPPFVQILPPPGYSGNAADDFGYDALPAYNYSTPIPACDPTKAEDPPWINLDETDQITLDSMYAGIVRPDVSLHNSSSQLIRFMAKANRSQYVYVASNSTASDPNKLWWAHIPRDVVDSTKAFLKSEQKSPLSGSSTMVS